MPATHQTQPDRSRTFREPDWPPIVDAHNDLLVELVHRRAEERPFARHWLPNLVAGGVALQICPTFSGEMGVLPELALRRALDQINAFNRAVRENEARVFPVKTADDIEIVERRERVGLLLAMEGMEALGYDASLIDVFHQLGVRMASLTWNRRNPFADGAAEKTDGGLSNLGRSLVARMTELGIVLDLAHASERTCWEVLESTDRDRPVVVSHAACRSVFDHERNLSDDQLRGVAEHGGVIGVMQVPFVIDPKRLSVERVVDHIDHAVAVTGIDHVGLGGDFMLQLIRATGHRPPPDTLLPDGLPSDATIEGLTGPQDYGNLVEALGARGYDGDRLEAILGGNFLRVLRRALPAG